MNFIKNWSFKILLPILLFGCGEKGFYDDSYDHELARIPIIKPYQIFSPNQGLDWFFYLSDNKGEQLTDIELVGVKDSFFVLYSNSHLIGQKDTTWCIVNTKSNEKFLRKSEIEYFALLDSLNIKDLRMYNVKSVFNEFNKTLKWPKEWPSETDK